MENLKTLIDEGIILEDEFIEIYLKVLKDEGFIEYFSDKEKATQLLQVLIDESKWHKDVLENIIKEL